MALNCLLNYASSFSHQTMALNHHKLRNDPVIEFFCTDARTIREITRRTDRNAGNFEKKFQ